ncbi:MAG: DUF2716 domain-containing protein [Ruminococcaceae bacterium]|nr:DUF2716 domain-containing protein [Oscillospiraceae bacterium]
MKLLKENEDFIYNFINNELRFYPSCNDNFFLPFSINRPFVVYDISQITDEQADLLYELAPTALANCLPNGYQLYAIDWFHNFILYDPRNPENMQSNEPATPQFNKDGIAYFNGFYPDGDYYFFLDKYGAFGYLSHPWREEVWIYGEPLIKEFKKIYKQIGFIPKVSIK